MSPSDEHSPRRVIAILLETAAGFGLTYSIFYPGVMTYDARYIYQYIATGFRGDWQSPVMTVLWGWIDPVAPGPGSMFLLTAALYWVAFGVIALALSRRSFALAFVLPILALVPPAFVFVGIIWRDVLFAVVWLLAAGLAFAVAESGRPVRLPAQLAAFALLAFGVLLRPNALIAAPVLAIYLLWPMRFSWRALAAIFFPAAIALYAIMQVVYYDVMRAKHLHPEQSLMVFDLGGITHFARQNAFPVAWSEQENKLLIESCYQPTLWDIYWTQDPCRFVMARLEGEKIFGSPQLTEAWRRAIVQQPLAYLEHRLAFSWRFLTGDNLTMWTRDLDQPDKIAFANRPTLMALKSIHDALKPTPLFRAGSWLLLDLILCAVAWPRRQTPAGAFTLGVCGSAALYVMTFFAIGVAADFRYGYWAVLAGLAGLAVFASSERHADETSFTPRVAE